MNIKINRRRENKFYLIFLVVVGICFTTFFTSKAWMYDDSPITQTPFHTEINGLLQTDLVLNKWEYNPSKKLMEVTIQAKHKGSDPVKPTFSFAAKERETKEEYPVEIVFDQDETIIVQIKNVPETYRVIGLFVKEIRDKKVLENEMKTAYLETSSGSLDQDEDEIKYKLPQPKEHIIVGDYRKIKTNKKLQTKTGIAYKEENVQREMKQVEKKIDVYQNEQIPIQNKLIEDLEKEIKALEEEMSYQTEEEKQNTLSVITSKKETIKNALNEKENFEKEIEILKEKRQKLKEKLEDIRNGQTKKQETEAENNEDSVTEQGE